MAAELICPNCSNVIVLKDLNVGDEFKCPYCKLQGNIPDPEQPVASFQVSDKPQENDNCVPHSSTDGPTPDTDKTRFPAVRALSGIIKVVAWILSFAAVIIGLVAIDNRDPVAGFGIFIGAALGLIILLAIADLMLVLLAIEENTRQSPK